MAPGPDDGPGSGSSNGIDGAVSREAGKSGWASAVSSSSEIHI